MKSTEKIEERKSRVKMHDFFIKKIDDAINNKRYIEAAWLIYSCFENRYFRTIEKIKGQCKYGNKNCKDASNKLALSTKINCIERLVHEDECTCFSDNFPDKLLSDTKTWIKKRNNLMHNLLRLDYYENTDIEFEKVAIEGKNLLEQTYNCCTEFRKAFFAKDYKFTFPESAMEKCACKPKKVKQINN